MRHPATVFALVLSLLSGFVLAELWSLGPVSSRSIQAVPSAQVEATTLAFYRGVNAYLADGDEAGLRRMLHLDFVTHQSGRTATGNAEEFFGQLDSIRRFYPDLQLVADVTPVSGNAASVTLSWNTVERRDFTGIEIDPGDLIGQLDLVRIERGLIVERWSSAQLAGRLHAFPALSIELPVALDSLIARVRQISFEHDTETIRNQFGHLLLVDLSGNAFLEVIRPVAITPAVWRSDRGQATTPVPIETASVVRFNALDAVFLPAGTMFRMWKSGDQEAELIALEFGPPVVGDEAPAAPLLADLRSTLWSGIKLRGVGNRLTLSFGQAELLPGATLSSPNVDGLQLAWVSSGAMSMTEPSGAARVRSASGLRSQLIEGQAVLAVGESGAAGPGTDVGYRAMGDASVTAWFFSLMGAPVQANASDSEVSSSEAPAPTPLPVRTVS